MALTSDKSISWEIADDYASLIASVLKNSEDKQLFKPDRLAPDQVVRHAETPALKRAWEDYITLWKLTNGD